MRVGVSRLLSASASTEFATYRSCVRRAPLSRRSVRSESTYERRQRRESAALIFLRRSSRLSAA